MANVISISLDLNSAEGYKTFLRVKSLPVYQFVGRTAIFPAEYADRMGMATPKVKQSKYTPSPFLFDYQRDISALAIKKQKFAVFADCGLGKDLIYKEYIRHVHSVLPKRQSILMVCPLMVIKQTIAETQRFYGDALPIEQVSAKDLPGWMHKGGRIGVTNYEAITDEVTQGRLGAMILDECFAPGTPVQVMVNDILVEKHIESVLIGDKIVNASGIDTVIGTKKREVQYACVITAGTRITCSPNHPFFTQRGWVCAQDIEPGDSVLQTGEAVRIVRGDVLAEGHAGLGKILRSILLSEMADESVGSQIQGSHQGSTCEDRQIASRMASRRLSQGECRVEENRRIESYVESGRAAEGQFNSKGHEAQTFRAWWKREAIDLTANDLTECSWTDLEGGIRLIVGKTKSRVSNLLQARLSEHRNESVHRSGWSLPLLAEGDGRKENGHAGFVRVESLEVLECGHPELERFRDADGKLYFHDIEAERHPSFSVNGLLVHNSSMLKSYYGAWGQRLIELGRGLNWKLAGTGTPAPNDRIEYANHAVLLDNFPTVNSFLAKYFVNRGETANRWEIKPHALKPFYRDLSHWSIFLTNPGVYGWKDNCGTLPPIHTHIEEVALTDEQVTAATRVGGDLFGSVGGIGSRSQIARIAKGVGCESLKPQYICDRVESFGDESSIVWCKYNAEQDALAAMMPDAGNIDGSTPHERREEIVAAFKAGEIRTIISKPKILGLGLNLQIATRQVFSTLQDSYEEYYQAVKRSNRYGSTVPLNVHIPVTDIERPMIETVLRKAHRVSQDTIEQETLFREMRQPK